MQEITITKSTCKGSNRINWNVDLNGKPFGQIWTYKARGEIHPFHVKTFKGFYCNYPAYADAEFVIRAEM